ncbi:MAG: AEC family transporter [Methanoregula sp. SKADARSKE-2]|nr:MAG: AEC family transporter [Methanoregula sp. SKADARSKE-2]
MDFLTVISAILLLFLIIGIGYVLRRHGSLNSSRVHGLSHILVNIALPALTISSMQIPYTEASAGIADSTLTLAFGYYIGAFFLGLVICHFLPSTKAEKGVFRFMLVFPNVGFMGIPVSAAILGHDALFYVILFNLPFNLLVFTMGVSLLAHGRPGKLDPKLLLTPGLVASIIGLAFFLLGYDIPFPADAALRWIGEATTPLAMIIVGAMLATLPVSRLAGDWRIALISGLRLLLLPILAFLILTPFIHDKLLLGTVVLLIAMPVAVNTVLLSEEYKVDATLASQGVFLSTVLCLATIPLLELFLFA